VSSAMVWDDHDMHDDWNISREWVREIRREPWWEGRVLAGIMSYWIYQHLGTWRPESFESWSCSNGCGSQMTPARSCVITLTAPTARRRGPAVIVSGDVHHAYLAGP
jgi:hypothetical protein